MIAHFVLKKQNILKNTGFWVYNDLNLCNIRKGTFMKREELVALGISDDTVIDKIMEINGNDIEHYKSTAETYKSQLKEARDTLKTFEGVDVNELQGKISKLTADLAAKDSEFQAKIADMEFDALLDGQISAAKAKNVKAVKALLDVDALTGGFNLQIAFSTGFLAGLSASEQ